MLAITLALIVLGGDMVKAFVLVFFIVLVFNSLCHGVSLSYGVCLCCGVSLFYVVSQCVVLRMKMMTRFSNVNVALSCAVCQCQTVSECRRHKAKNQGQSPIFCNSRNFSLFLQIRVIPTKQKLGTLDLISFPKGRPNY